MAADTTVKTRADLRALGTEVRQRLNFPERQGKEPMPGFGDLATEVVFGRVWGRPALPLEDRILATLSALTAKQYLPQLRLYVGPALHLGHSPQLIQEVMLHCAMYAGIPSALNSLEVVNAVLEEKGLPQPDLAPPELDLDQLTERGEQMKKTLHAEQSADGYASAEAAASELYATVATQYLYGEVWERPGITTRQRMICSVAAFTALQMETQQRKFYRSALNVGLSRDEIFEVIIQTGPYSGFPTALNAVTIAGEVLDGGNANS